MTLLGTDKLQQFKLTHSDARANIESWEAEIEEAEWKTPHEMKQKYPSADPIGKQNTIFNINGNKYRLWVTIDYQEQIVIIKKIGTHKEYEKWDMK